MNPKNSNLEEKKQGSKNKRKTPKKAQQQKQTYTGTRPVAFFLDNETHSTLKRLFLLSSTKICKIKVVKGRR